jgi:hypothetical protein
MGNMIVSNDNRLVMCDKCKERSEMHHIGDRKLCCTCYVKEGFPPADWHPTCMEAYKRISNTQTMS